MKAPPDAVRDTGQGAQLPGPVSNAQMNAADGSHGTPDRATVLALLRPLLHLRAGWWSH